MLISKTKVRQSCEAEKKLDNLENLELYTRRNNVLITCIPKVDKESLNDIVIDCGTKAVVHLGVQDIN